MTTEYEELTGSGQFVKWETVGQFVEGTVAAFSLDGGKDFDGNACPEITLDTTDGLQTVTCAQASIKRIAMSNSEKFVAGAKCRITYSGTYESKSGTPGKEFKVGIAPPAMVEL